MRHANYCRCRACRREIASFESGLLRSDIAAVTVMAVLAGIIWTALAPLRIWHVTGADGQEHPDGATWIAYGISGAVIMAVLMYFSIRATAEPAPARVPASVTEALEIAASLEDDHR